MKAQRVTIRETGQAGTVVGRHGDHWNVLLDGEETPCGWDASELVAAVEPVTR